MRSHIASIAVALVATVNSLWAVTPSIPVLASNDAAQDVEPAVVVTNRNGVDYVTTVYMRYVMGPPTLTQQGVPQLVSKTTTNLSSGIFIEGSLSLPSSSYNRGLDPALARDSRPVGTGYGGRVYCAALADYNASDLDHTNIPNAIVLWYSDDGGTVWSTPHVIASHVTAGSHLAYDKPAIAVSRHVGPDQGYIYVSFTDRDQSGYGNNKIVLARSADGGQTFSIVPNSPAGNAAINNSQVVVDPRSGDVYVLWVDFPSSCIMSARSMDHGDSFMAPEQGPCAATGHSFLVAPYSPVHTIQPYLRSGVIAYTIPIARWNDAKSVIGVVWHEREGIATGTDYTTYPPTNVYYAYHNDAGWQRSSLTPPSCSSSPAPLCCTVPPCPQNDDYPNSDQFMPALDSDPNGNVTIVWYDTRDDNGGRRYHEYAARFTFTGGFYQSNTRVSLFKTDPCLYTSGPGSVQRTCFIGDYQDIISWPFGVIPRFLTGWVGIPASGVGNIYLDDLR